MGYQVRRRHQLRQSRYRRAKIEKLKAELARTASRADREKLSAKIRRISPYPVTAER